MMNRVQLMVICFLVLAAGCNGGPTLPQHPPELPPLTLEQWKVLPVEEKYDEATFDRMRQADASLRSDRAWQKFMKEVVVPERKIDIPGIPGQQ